MLRARCLPAIPYLDIAGGMLLYWLPQARALVSSSTTAPTPESKSVKTIEDFKRAQKLEQRYEHPAEVRNSLGKILEEEYEKVEQESSPIFNKALERKEEDVKMILTLLDRGKLDGEVVVVLEKGEAELQAGWRRVGDWRAGSLPDLTTGGARFGVVGGYAVVELKV